MKIAYAIINEMGKRPYQEDSVGTRMLEQEALFLVADGLGGHGCGDVASRETINYVQETFQEGLEPKEYFQNVFVEANELLRKLQDEQQMTNGMKTTLVAALVKGKNIYGAYIGDSRIYVFEDGKIIYRSLDHSVPQMLVAAGEIEEKQIRNHPDRNRLLRVLGDRDRETKPQHVGPFPIRGKMAILLCTDGFWENVLEFEMERTLKKSKDPNEWMERMKKIAARRGFFKNQDNYSAIGVTVD